MGEVIPLLDVRFIPWPVRYALLAGWLGFLGLALWKLAEIGAALVRLAM